jgi:hypothetical protein
VDENPANNDPENLAVLCLDCHRDTQIRGGFDRKLDEGQVRLYRDDWLERVRKYRMAGVPEWPDATGDRVEDARITAAKLEAAKARENWCEVAQIYDEVEEYDMRDRYIDLARSQNPGPFYEFLFARMQGTVRDNTCRGRAVHRSGRTVHSTHAPSTHGPPGRQRHGSVQQNTDIVIYQGKTHRQDTVRHRLTGAEAALLMRFGGERTLGI